MQEACDKIAAYTSGMDFKAFCADPGTVDAVVRNLEIIGEMSNGIPEDQKLQRPDIDWRAIPELRNRIVHEYFGLSLLVIWAVVQQDLPTLAQQASRLALRFQQSFLVPELIPCKRKQR